MKNLFLVLVKVFVREFYRMNAGFFLVVIGISFGFLRKFEHIALAQFFISTIFLLAIPVGMWVMYTFKIIQFNRHAISLPQNAFVSSFLLLPRFNKMLILAGIAVFQLLPAVAYGAFLAAMTNANHMDHIICTIFGTLGAMAGMIAYSLHQNLFFASQGTHVTFIKRIFDSQFTKPQLQFFIEWIIRRQPLFFFGTKLFACFILGGVARLYLFDTYDARLLGLGMVMSAAANSLIVFHHHRFENQHFQLLRNLPHSLSRRIVFFLLTFIILCAPEWILLVRFFPPVLPVIVYVELIVLGLSFIVLSYAILYIRHIDIEKFLQYIFYLFMGLMLLILFKVSIVILAILQLGASLYLVKKYYYSFEFIAGKE